jgi:hypothetical protein
MKLDVPYYSQFVDVSDHYWMLRACGGVCLKSVVEFHGKEVTDLVSLCNEAKERGGYHLENGWVHEYIVTKVNEYGLEAYRKEGIVDVGEIVTSLLEGNPVIVSVEKRVLEQTRFHMIVLVGYESFYYHESESTIKEKGMNRVCSSEVFMQYFRGKAIFITKKNT